MTTTANIHADLATGSVLSLGLSKDRPTCTVEQAGTAHLSNAFAAVEVAPSDVLDRIAVADLKAGVPRGLWIRVALRPPALPGRGATIPRIGTEEPHDSTIQPRHKTTD